MEKLAIIDCDSICYTACFGIKLLDEQGNPIKVDNKFTYRDKTDLEVYDSVNTIMEDILRTTESKSYIGFIKGKNTITSRKEVNPTYKANRTSELPQHYAIAKKHLIEYWNCVEVNNYEVDDIVNAAYNHFKNEYYTIRVSIDKDLMSLAGNNYNWRKKEIITNTLEDEAYFFWKSMIAGDSADGCKGLPNKGPKFAEKILLGEGSFQKNTSVFPQIVLGQYVIAYGEDTGIREYYKSYNSLKILDTVNDYEYPEINVVNLPVLEEVDVLEEIPNFNEN